MKYDHQNGLILVINNLYNNYYLFIIIKHIMVEVRH